MCLIRNESSIILMTLITLSITRLSKVINAKIFNQVKTKMA